VTARYDGHADWYDAAFRRYAGEDGSAGRFPVRSRVGARNLTLATFLNAFLSQHTLRLDSVTELDTTLTPWTPDPRDCRVVPWNIAVVARRS
jgi:hypothetical protein